VDAAAVAAAAAASASLSRTAISAARHRAASGVPTTVCDDRKVTLACSFSVCLNATGAAAFALLSSATAMSARRAAFAALLPSGRAWKG